MRAVGRPDHRAARALGRRWRDAETAVVWDAHLGGCPVCLIGIESRPLPRRGAAAGRRPGPVDVGHAVPAVVEEGGARDQRRQRQPPGRRARQPLRLRRLARVDAPAAARVRRRDRPRGRQLPTARSCSASSRATTAAPSSCSRSSSTTSLEAVARRGLVRLGDRRRAGRGAWSSPARSTRRARARPARRRARRSGCEAADGAERQRLRAERAALVETVRSEKLGEVAAEFDAHPQRRARASRSARSSRIIPAATLRPS